MTWVVRHKRPSGTRFLYNMYKHYAVFIMKGESKVETTILYSKEGVTQGCLLTMVGCSIILLPLILQLKKEFNNIKSPWYADDGAAAGNIGKRANKLMVYAILGQAPYTSYVHGGTAAGNIGQIVKKVNSLCGIGLDNGYFPEESKSIPTVKQKDEK